MKRKFVLILFMFIVGVNLFSENVEKGKIRANGKVFLYKLTPQKILITDRQNNEVFRLINNNDFSSFLGVGYSKEYKSFFIINETLRKKGDYLIKIIFRRRKSISFCNNESIYSPILYEDDSDVYLLFINNSFEIDAYDLKAKKRIVLINFDSPILFLKLSEDKKYISFLKFEEGKYVKVRMNVRNLIKLKILKSIQKLVRVERDDFKKNLEDIILDYYKFLGFGDSITYGYINTKPAPELGYIPRLQYLVDSWYGGEVINEGVPAEKTYEGVERFEQVILEHKAKFLLFHEGTNDVIHYNIPVSATLYNIRYMINTALKYEIVPIITTLIPRNGWFGQGIFREKAIEVCEGIREIANELDIPLIDFWEIFSDYPESDGGYESLMSDVVHPSEKGYQLMAENWFKTLQNIPPGVPDVLSLEYSIDPISKIVGIKFLLCPEKDPDFRIYNVYVLNENKSEKKLYKSFDTNSVFIILPPGKKYLIGLTAVDNFGNESKLSKVFEYISYRLFF